MTSRRISSIDALLLLMTIIWGTNYSIVKTAFQQIDPQAFNALRMIIASMTFLVIIADGQAHARDGSAWQHLRDAGADHPA